MSCIIMRIYFHLNWDLEMETATLNPNPVVYASVEDLDRLRLSLRARDQDESVDDPFDALEVFDILFLRSLSLSPSKDVYPP